jgi:hypothetical protein
VWILSILPLPDEDDIIDRAERKPMNNDQRKTFVKEFGLGLIMFIFSYVVLTAYREFRDNFMPELLLESGLKYNSSIFTKTEIPIAIAVLVIMASFRWITNHKRAFALINVLLILGTFIIAVSTFLFEQQLITEITWLVCVGFGAYIAYAMCNSLYFERMLASFRNTGTVGFLITLSDFYAYFGSILVLFYKNFFYANTSNITFFIYSSYLVSCFYFVSIMVSWLYLRKKYKTDVQ